MSSLNSKNCQTPTMNNILDSVYFNPESSGSFVSGPRVLETVNKTHPSITLPIVTDYLRKNITHSLHRPARRRWRRNRIIVSGIGELVQADLVDLQMFSSQNDGYKYLLTFIDVFSKKAWVKPLKTKKMTEVKAAFESIFEEFVPSQIQTDKGTEFKNKEVAYLMKKHGINLFFSMNEDIKCAVVERFNRTLKGRMFKYFTSIGKRKYIDVLNKLVRSYNTTFHRTIKMAPESVNYSNSKMVFFNTYGHQSRRDLINNTLTTKPRFKVGDIVRIKYTLTQMDKSYYPNWSDMLYEIVHVIMGNRRPLYRLKDENGNTLKKRYYDEELSLSNRETPARIEKIIKHDKKNRRLLVKWLNTPSSLNSWVPENSDLILTRK